MKSRLKPDTPTSSRLPKQAASASGSESTHLGSLKEQTHVAFCCNSRYIRHMAVAAVSLLINNPCRPFAIHLILTDHDREELLRLERSLEKFPNARLHVYFFDANRCSQFFIDKHLTVDTYLRLFLADILDDAIDKLIYLDSDLVVRGNIDELCDIQMGTKILAGVPDCNDADRRRSLMLPGPELYINAGVLVIDLKRWRESNLTRLAQDIIMQFNDSLYYFDQDVINIMLRGTILPLNLQWNFAVWRMRRYFTIHPQTLRRYDEARERATIVHFAGHEKPWRFAAVIPCKALYWRYRQQTEWATIADGGFTIVRTLAFPIRMLLHMCRINPNDVHNRAGWLWRLLKSRMMRAWRRSSEVSRTTMLMLASARSSSNGGEETDDG
jgi:lipopolysaccharide biosynthesis glycosyltransferase